MYFLLTGFDCGGADVLKVIKFIWNLFEVAFIIIPIILIAIVSFDFFKNVMAGKEDDMKKNLNIVFKRFLYCIAIFLVEIIVQTAINLLGDAGIDFAECINIATTEDLSQYEIIPEESYDAETPNWDKNNNFTGSDSDNSTGTTGNSSST